MNSICFVCTRTCVREGEDKIKSVNLIDKQTYKKVNYDEKQHFQQNQ